MAAVSRDVSTAENAHGRIGVAFSSGFFGFFAHAGFLAALRKTGLAPLAYAGASSGAIVAAMAACGMPDDAIKEMLFNVKKADFWDPDPIPKVLARALRLFRGYGGYLNGNGFAALLERLPVKQIEACQRPLAISAVDVTHKKEKIFTRGNLLKAIQASGSVPMLFKPTAINGHLYLDGGISSKAPVEALARLSRLDTILVHFITSENVKKPGNDFMKKRFTPWRTQHIAINTARMMDYERQKRIVSMLGVEIVEINTEAPSVGPGSLDKGPAVYEAARASALKALKEIPNKTQF